MLILIEFLFGRFAGFPLYPPHTACIFVGGKCSACAESAHQQKYQALFRRGAAAIPTACQPAPSTFKPGNFSLCEFLQIV